MSSITLTPKEMELLKEVGKFIQTSAVDWGAIATKLGYPAPKKARDKWYPLRDKLFGGEGSADGTTPKKSGGKRKAGDDDKAVPATPAKKNKRGKKVDSPVEDDDDELKADGKVKGESEGEFV